jgi:hypothetical protein
MSAHEEIDSILEQWLQLTEAEGAAIQKGNWPEVKRLQCRKGVLRQPLSEAIRHYAADPARPGSRHFRSRVARLNSLLTRNGALLADQLRRARARQETLNQTRRNLQGIGRIYGRSRSGHAWHSYS